MGVGVVADSSGGLFVAGVVRCVGRRARSASKQVAIIRGGGETTRHPVMVLVSACGHWFVLDVVRNNGGGGGQQRAIPRDHAYDAHWNFVGLRARWHYLLVIALWRAVWVVIDNNDELVY